VRGVPVARLGLRVVAVVPGRRCGGAACGRCAGRRGGGGREGEASKTAMLRLGEARGALVALSGWRLAARRGREEGRKRGRARLKKVQHREVGGLVADEVGGGEEEVVRWCRGR